MIAHSKQIIFQLTDSELYQKCREYGASARSWTRKFAGLLPEVFRRQLYKNAVPLPFMNLPQNWYRHEP